MDPKAANYRAYFVKSDPSRCSGTVGTADAPFPDGFSIAERPEGVRLSLPGAGPYRIAITDSWGNLRMTWKTVPGGGADIPIAGLGAGIRFVLVSDGKSIQRLRFTRIPGASRP
jgi:hypothetical protein